MGIYGYIFWMVECFDRYNLVITPKDACDHIRGSMRLKGAWRASAHSRLSDLSALRALRTMRVSGHPQRIEGSRLIDSFEVRNGYMLSKSGNQDARRRAMNRKLRAFNASVMEAGVASADSISSPREIARMAFSRR